jgi:mycofactocin precursor peptide peptidase
VSGAAQTLADTYWPDVEQAARRVLVVPVGSLEQHGPHLPLDTDTRIAAEVARRACANRPGVAIAPPFAIGASGEHAAFPGTLSIGLQALATCLIELGRHASLHWPATLLVNGHGGNAAAIEEAVRTLRQEGRNCAAWHAGLPEGDAHAGRFETSIMLALAPQAVRIGAAAPGDGRPLGELMPVLAASGVRAVSPNGVLGDPSGASAGEGERLLARLTAALNRTLDALPGRASPGNDPTEPALGRASPENDPTEPALGRASPENDPTEPALGRASPEGGPTETPGAGLAQRRDM